MKLFLIVAFFTMVAASPPSIRIIDGVDATLEQFPWQVSVQAFRRHFCGGSLISNSWVLTAAHCRNFSIPLRRTTVVMGIISLNAVSPTRESVAQFTLHPNFNVPTYLCNDLALIRLGQAVTFSNTIRSIQLANFGNRFAGTVLASGWGRTRSGNPPSNPSNKLKYGDLRLITNAACQRFFSVRIHVSMLCAGGRGESYTSTCLGDSGGPVTGKTGNVTILIGVVSFNDINCSITYPSVFASVAHNRRWITSISGI